MNLNLGAMANPRIPVTDRTPIFLDQRADDDFRLAFIYDLMYGDHLPGQSAENGRYVELVGEESPNPIKVELRKAKVHDTIQYTKTADSNNIRVDIEKNISNIAKLKAVGAGLSGCPPIKTIWVIVYTQDENGVVRPNIYYNPNAGDCGDILRTDKEIIMTAIVVTYEIIPYVDEDNDGIPDEVYEWMFVSPIEETVFDEVEENLIKEEAELFSHIFNIEFDAKEVATTWRTKRKAEEDRKAFEANAASENERNNNVVVMPTEEAEPEPSPSKQDDGTVNTSD